MGRIIALLFLGACWTTPPRPLDAGPCSSTESKTECPADYTCASVFVDGTAGPKVLENRCTLLPGEDAPCDRVGLGCQEGLKCSYWHISEEPQKISRCRRLPGDGEPCCTMIGCQDPLRCYTLKLSPEEKEATGLRSRGSCGDPGPYDKCVQACKEQNPGGKPGKGPGSSHDRGHCMRNCS